MIYETDGYVVTETKQADGSAQQIDLTVTSPTNTQIDVTVYQDESGGTTADNSETLTDVTSTTYSLSNFTTSSGATYWLRFDLSTTDDSVTPEVDGATVTVYAEYARQSTLYGNGEITDTRTITLPRTSTIYGNGEITATRSTSLTRTSNVYGGGEITGMREKLVQQRTSNVYGVGEINGTRDVKREVSIMTAQEQWDNYGIAFYEGTNTYRLVTALLGYERNTNLTRFKRNHYVSTATTNALDRIGQLVQCYRKEGESDEKYAARIKAFGAASKSDGTFRDIIDIVKTILGIPYENIEISYSGAQATITVPVNSLNNTELTDSEFTNVVEKSVFAGHRIVIAKAGDDPFTLKTASNADDSSLGLSSENVEGGGLVEQI